MMFRFTRVGAIGLAAMVLFAAAAFAETSDQVRDAQVMMRRLGCYDGPVTGELTKATAASFTTWLFRHDLPAGTPLNVKTLKLMAADLGEDGEPQAPASPAPAPGLPGFVLLALALALPL